MPYNVWGLKRDPNLENDPKCRTVTPPASHLSSPQAFAEVPDAGNYLASLGTGRVLDLGLESSGFFWGFAVRGSPGFRFRRVMLEVQVWTPPKIPSPRPRNRNPKTQTLNPQCPDVRWGFQASLRMRDPSQVGISGLGFRVWVSGLGFRV